MVPEGWEIKPLGSICDVKGGKRLPKGRSLVSEPTPYPYIRVSDMRDGYVDTSDIRYIPEDVAPTIARYTISSDDLFISVAGTLGMVGCVPALLDGANLTENADKLTNIRAHKEYLLAVLQSPWVQKAIDNEKTTSAQPKLALERIRSFKIPVPPLPEQRKIAEILSTWDRAIETAEALLATARTQKRALMQTLLTGKRRFPEFEGQDWTTCKASEVFETVSIKKRPNEPLLAVTQEQGVVRRDELERRVVMPEGSTEGYKLVVPGNFIISLRSFQGGLEYSDVRGLVSPAYHVLQPTQQVYDPFYKHYFKSYDFIGHLAVAIIGIRDGKQISYADFSFLQIPNPSIAEQQRIGAALDVAQAEVDNLADKLAELRTEKKALMQQLLTGKRRVQV